MKIALATALALVLATPALAAGNTDVFAILHADNGTQAPTETVAETAPESAPASTSDVETTGALPEAGPAATATTAQAFFLADAAARAQTDGEAQTTTASTAPAARREAAPPSGGSVHDLVTAAALRHGIDPALAHAVATVESRYRCSAVGRAGELGVMQVKPATARSVGVTGNLRDCATGIEAGMRYLKAALERHGTGCAGVSAYNMGIHRTSSVCNGYGRKVMARMGSVQVASLD